MTLEQLKIFVSIASNKSIGSAAATLNKTPSTLSSAIKELENHLKIKLFDRSSYRLELTENGKQLLEKAENILNQSAQLERTALELTNNKFEKNITISIGPSCPTKTISEIVNIVSNLSPSTTLHFETALGIGSSEYLLDEKIDLAIAFQRFVLNGIESIPLFKSSVVCVVREDIYKKHSENENLIFTNVPRVLLYNPNTTENAKYFISDKFLSHSNYQFKNIFVSTNEAQLRLIDSGTCWGYLLNSDLDQINSSKTQLPFVELKSAPFNRIEFEISILRKSNRALGPVARTIWDYFKNPQLQVT